MKGKRKATPRQTSDRVSTIAGKLLDMSGHGRFMFLRSGIEAPPLTTDVTAWVSALCGSALAQDQTKGKRKAARR